MLSVLRLCLILGILALIGLVLYVTPLSIEVSTCYLQANTAYDNLGFTEKINAEDKRLICENRFQILDTLEECLTTARVKRNFSEDLNSIALLVYRTFQPWTRDLLTLKSEHNRDCRGYVRTQL